MKEDADGNLVLGVEELGTDLTYLDLAPSPEKYEAALQTKVSTLKGLFQPYWPHDTPTIFRSPPMHHRLRAKLGVGMVEGKLSYLMWDEEKKPVPVATFPIASQRINDLMPRLLAALETGPVDLRSGLRAVNFLDTLAGDTLISLMYKLPLVADTWMVAARVYLKDALGVQVVGRSKGVILPVDRTHVLEVFDLFPAEEAESDKARPSLPVLRYKQVEGNFSNPNGHMAIHTLRWLCSRADAILSTNKSSTSSSPCDLLELYCGGGNHTVALSRKFRRVVGVEINCHLVAVARENLALNGLTNATIIQIPSEKFRPDRLEKYRRQERAGAGVPCDGMEEEEEEEADAMTYDFGVVLVDPPRAGLDRHTRKLVSQYEHILYISCGPCSLLKDLGGETPEEQQRDKKNRSIAGFGLSQTHEVIDMCILDHFPGTTHIETAVHLRRR